MIVGVIGAGTMGAGIAQVALAAGHEVLLYDVDEAAVERGRARVEDGLERLVGKGTLTADDREAIVGRLRSATTLVEVVESAELIIEAALEDLDLKRTVFRALDEGSADALLATNTSALPVSAIASVASRPERIVGLHFFNPAPLMPLVEVVQAEQTSARAMEQAIAFVDGLGKTPIPCRDAPGFIVNRVNRPFTLEALRMLEAGEADVTTIDTALRSGGYPMGPFELMDLVGVDVNYAVARALYAAFDEAIRFTPSPIQARLVEAGELGRKSGRGFYQYQDGKRGEVLVHPEAGAAGTLAHDAIVRRVELAIINEAYHAVGEEVADPPDIDRALRLGANHPHGPFDRAGALGLRVVVEGLQALAVEHGERFRVAPALRTIATV